MDAFRESHLNASQYEAVGWTSMVKAPSLAGQSSPSQPFHMEAFGSRLLYTLWRSDGANPPALGG